METQLFSWEDFDPIDDQEFLFIDCVLRVPVGAHPAGSRWPMIEVNWETSTLTLYPTDEGIGGEEHHLLVSVAS